MNGTLQIYQHHNFNSSEDFHTTYNFTSGQVTRVDTKDVTLENGTKVREVTDTNSWEISHLDTTSEEYLAMREESKTNPTEIDGCVFGDATNDALINEHLISIPQDNIKKGFVLYYPKLIQIQDIQLNQDTKELLFILPENSNLSYLSISIPRELIDHGKEPFNLNVDGEPSDFRESTTDNFRTINLSLPESTHEIVVGGSKILQVELQEKQEMMLSPLKQFKSGVMPENIECKDDFSLVVKESNGNPVCVKQESVEKLISRGCAESF